MLRGEGKKSIPERQGESVLTETVKSSEAIIF